MSSSTLNCSKPRWTNVSWSLEAGPLAKSTWDNERRKNDDAPRRWTNASKDHDTLVQLLKPALDQRIVVLRTVSETNLGQ